jgi:hypothetical protein
MVTEGSMMSPEQAEIMKTVEDSLDRSILSLSSMAEGYAKEYLPKVSGALWRDLWAAGFTISRVSEK